MSILPGVLTYSLIGGKKIRKRKGKISGKVTLSLFPWLLEYSSEALECPSFSLVCSHTQMAGPLHLANTASKSKTEKPGTL